MSRAFVKETDGDSVPEPLPRRTHSDAPNYITPRGLVRLRERLAELARRRQALAEEPDRLGKPGELQRVEGDLAYVRERVERAIVVVPGGAARDIAGVGATIGLIDERGEQYRFTLVGEDEVEVEAGRISWTSPLGRAVMHRRVGESVTWRRPAGDLEVEILGIEYEK